MTAKERGGEPGYGNRPHVLREYALLADGERGVLVGPRGDFSWLCFPSWDSEAIFASLIGGRGTFAVHPEGRYVWGGYYEDGTLIWTSRWMTDDGALIECREALALPTTAQRALILRRIRVLGGSARIRVSVELRRDYGRHAATGLARDDGGSWHARLGSSHAMLTGVPEATVTKTSGERTICDQLKLKEGEHADLTLVLDAEGRPEDRPEPDQAWEQTAAAWAERVPSFEGSLARRDVRHSYAVLAGLTSAGGAMVAAATMSLPERAREGRNYDYRYAWIRDQCYAGQAVASGGPHGLLHDAVRFVGARLLDHGDQLSPAYTVTGEEVPGEEQLDLSGYPGGADVIGNRVRDQFQLDAFGEALLLFAAADREGCLEADGWKAAQLAIAAIESRWREPEAGVWEIYPDEWTQSRLICAAGLRAIAERAGEGQAAPWVALADRLIADCAERCVHPTGRWQRSPQDDRVDSSLLLPAIRGALPRDDPRSTATLRAVEEELTEDGYAYRYRPDARPLGEAEGAFLLCGFFLSLAHIQQGNRVRAARWFERTRASCGPPGLLSEEFDVAQRQMRGNLPQAFVHALLLETAHAQEEGEGSSA